MQIFDELKQFCECEISRYLVGIIYHSELIDRCEAATNFAGRFFISGDPIKQMIIDWWYGEMLPRLNSIEDEGEAWDYDA